MTLRTIDFRHGGESVAILLPGAQMRPEDIVSAGIPAASADRSPAFDLCLVDLGIDSITGEHALDCLQEEVVRPAREAYRQVWLGGISLGGLLALCHAADHPGSVDGLCLLAPYPGSRITQNAIERAGGLAHWRASEAQLADPEFRVWRFLQSPPPDLPVFIGYGEQDRFVDGVKRIADCLPQAARQTLPGGHDWDAWSPLWERFLDFQAVPPR